MWKNWNFFIFPTHSAPNHYQLAMHVFGLLTTANSLEDLDDMVESAAVVFSSAFSAANVEKHFNNLQSWLKRTGTQMDETAKSQLSSEDLMVNTIFGKVRTFILSFTYIYRKLYWSHGGCLVVFDDTVILNKT